MFRQKDVESLTDNICGIPPQNCKQISVKFEGTTALLKWKEPADTVIEGQTVCTVAGARVVRKEDDFPQSENDGVVVYDNKKLGAYAVTPFIDTGLDPVKKYYYCVFPYNTHGVHNRSKRNRTSQVYGMKIDKNDSNPATRVTYTDDAEGFIPAKMNFTTGQFEYGDWADAWFVQGNYPCMLYSSGIEAYKLNPDDYAQKEDGSASDITNTAFDGNVMTAMPTVWVKRWEDDNYRYRQFCNIQMDDSFKAYAHMRADESVMDIRYYPTYGGSLISGKLRSLSNQSLMNSQTGTNELTYAKANNPSGKTLWDTTSFSMETLRTELCELIGKSTDSQTVFGRGHESGGTQAGHLLKTGLLDTMGQFYGYNDSTHQVKVFHMEMPWADQWQRVTGWMYIGNKVFLKPYPPYNTTGTDYIDTGITCSGTSGGYINTMKSTPYGDVPVTASGSSATYEADGLWFANGTMYALRGGVCSDGALVGSRALNLDNAVSYSHWKIGAGLSCEQPV